MKNRPLDALFLTEPPPPSAHADKTMPALQRLLPDYESFSMAVSLPYYLTEL
jgi:hypothetical protein